MACENCKDTPKSFPAYFTYDPKCNEPQSPCGCGDVYDASCVRYTGAPLSCIGVSVDDSLELALQKINTIICQNTSNGFPSYNYHCLAEDGPITSQGQFVDRVTAKLCTLNTNFSTFVNTTFPTYQTSTDSRLTNLESPKIVCTSASVGVNDSLSTVLSKYCNKFSNIDSNLDLTGVNWNQCFVVNNPPTTVKGGFQTVISQICSLKNSGISLPTFNNVGSCLPTPLTSNDTLYDTVEKIKTRLCQTATFNTTGINFGCVSTPATVTLDSTIAAILSKVTQNTQNTINTVVGGSLSYVDPSNPCLGKVLTITGGGSTTDRFVAATPADTNPGTLADKLVPGGGVTIDVITDPSQAKISSDGKVLVSATDGNRGFLQDKIESDDSAAVIVEVTKTGSSEENLTLSGRINSIPFLNQFFEALESNPTFRNRFCQLVGTCSEDKPLYEIFGYAGPFGGNDGFGQISFYSDVPLTSNNEFTLGANIYSNSDGSTVAPNGRYFVYAGGDYNYADTENGVITAIGTVLSADFVLLGSAPVAYNATTFPACNAPRTKILYNPQDAVLNNGDLLYKDYYNETPADDGYYSYTAILVPALRQTFQIVSGAVTNASTC